MLLPPTASRSCCLPSSGMLLCSKPTEVKALLTLIQSAIPSAPAPSTWFFEKSSAVRVVFSFKASNKAFGPSGVGIHGPKLSPSLSYAPILLSERFSVFNALLNRMFNGQKCSTENKFVSIGLVQTKQNSNSS